MAGTEFSGIQHALPNMFQGAHYILTPDEGTQPEHLALMERVARHLGCADVVRTTPEQHDAIIAYTSQMMHIIAVSVCDDPMLFTCKGFEGKQDHYRCSKYKSGRGECSAHYIREDVLRELVQERIQAVNEYIRSDVEGFQEEWLHYRRADQERDIREDQKRMEQAKKRLATLDVVISRLYEDYALGEISKEKYKKMTSDYEAEQERLKLEIETTEEWVEQRQAMGDDLDAFIALTKKYVDVTELTQTIVNEYIRKIIIHAPDKSGGKRRQKVEIFFNFVDDVEIPVLAEPMIAESTIGRRKTA